MIEAFVQIDSDDPNHEAMLFQMLSEGWKIHATKMDPYPSGSKKAFHYYLQKPIQNKKQ